MPEFNSAHRVLHDLAQSYGWDIRFWEFRLRTHWAEIVGHPLAAHTHPDKIQYRQLHLIVENSLWHQQLIFLKSSLLTTLNAAIGKPLIADLVFRIGECPSLSPSQETKEPVNTGVSPSHGMIQEAARQTAAIKNPALRHALTRVMAKALTEPVMTRNLRNEPPHRTFGFPQTTHDGQTPA